MTARSALMQVGVRAILVGARAKAGLSLTLIHGRRGYLYTDRAALQDEASLYGGRRRSHFAVQARLRGREEEVLSRKGISTAKTSTDIDGEIRP